MSEILGLLDSLEAAILDGKRIPMTDQLIINEKDVIHIIDKIRLVINSGGDVIRRAVDISPQAQSVAKPSVTPPSQESVAQAHDIIEEANQAASRIKDGANHYADNVLANLQLLITKLQKNVISIEKNLENGREVLEKERSEHKETPQHET